MHEDELRAQWYAIARRLDATADRVMIGIPPIACNDEHATAKIAIAGLLRKAHRDFKAMLVLDAAGFCDSAQILARAVLEACISALYINKEPVERGTQFWQHEFQQRADLGKRLKQVRPIDEKAEGKLAQFKSFISEHSPPGKPHLKWLNVGDMIDDFEVSLQPFYRMMLKDYHYEARAAASSLQQVLGVRRRPYPTPSRPCAG